MAATPIAFFGLKLVPGKVHRMDVFRDFKITNISYAEEPKAGSKTLVKVHHVRMPGFDDDQEDSDEESEKEDDEEEEDAEKVYTLCSLSAGKVEQATVDLQFCEEELIGFSITGNTPVDLVGNYVAGPDHYDQDPSSDEIYSDDDEDDFSDEEAYGALMDEDDESDDDEEEDSSRFEELVQPKPKKAAIEAAPTPSKKRSADVAAAESTPAKTEAKQLQKKLKGEFGTPTASPAQVTVTPTKVTETKVEKQTKAAKDAKPQTEAAAQKSVEKPGSKVSRIELL